MADDDDRESLAHSDSKPDEDDDNGSRFNNFLKASLTTPVDKLPPVPKMPETEEEERE